jgi:acetylglutamate kinase
MMTFAGERRLEETQAKAETLLEALPYLKRFPGRIAVVKVGGELFANPVAAASLAQDLILLHSVGIRVVLCHGGGPQISEMMKRFGKEPKFINGQRVTDKETLEITSMVLLGVINRTIVSLLNAHGRRAVGLSGVDGGMFTVEQKNPELGYVGKVTQVCTEPIMSVLESGFLPVIASLGIDTSGEVYNVNADIAAGELAVALKAEKLVTLTNVEGLYRTFGDEDSLISEIDSSSLKDLLEKEVLSAGMIPKAESIVNALERGVEKAHILDGRVDHAVLLEIFTPEGIGTMITPGAVS